MKANKKTINRPYTIKDVTIVEEGKVRKVIAAAALGNAMEWFDFGVYGYLVTALGKVFFPAVSPAVQLVATLATLSVPFVMRPLGGLVFGRLGDKYGRHSILAATIVIMSISTFCIGLIPSFNTIGIWAPIALLVCKMAQGFSVGGEYTGASIFIAEYSPDRSRGFWGSFLDFGAIFGFITGAAVVELITMYLGEAGVEEWGWRLPFFMALPLGVIGILLRNQLEETPDFQQHTKDENKKSGAAALEAKEAISFKEILTKYWRALLLCVGMVITTMIATHLILTYMPSYLTGTLGYSPGAGVFIMMVTMIGMLFIQPTIGWLSDIVGRRPFFFIGSLALIFVSVPAFYLLGSGSHIYVFLGLLIFAIIMNCFTGVLGATIPALFPTAVRYSALASAFNIAVVVAGLSPTIMAGLVSYTGDKMMPAYYMVVVGVIGLVTSFFMHETANKPLRGSKPMATDLAEAREILLEHFETIEEKIEAIDEEMELLSKRREQLAARHPHVD